jgi:hypothetical protein
MKPPAPPFLLLLTYASLRIPTDRAPEDALGAIAARKTLPIGAAVVGAGAASVVMHQRCAVSPATAMVSPSRQMSALIFPAEKPVRLELVHQRRCLPGTAIAFADGRGIHAAP